MASVGAREARYAEVVGRLYLTTSGGGVHSIEDIAHAVMAIADEESAARAEAAEKDRDRIWEDFKALAEQVAMLTRKREADLLSVLSDWDDEPEDVESR